MSFENVPGQGPEGIPVLTDRIEEIDMPILEIPQTEQMRLDTERMQKEISELINVQTRQDAEVRMMAVNADTKAILRRASDIASMTAKGVAVKSA